VGGAGGPAATAVRPATETKRLDSAAGQVGSDWRWAGAGGNGGEARRVRKGRARGQGWVVGGRGGGEPPAGVVEVAAAAGGRR
jgi:hypothetical protein